MMSDEKPPFTVITGGAQNQTGKVVGEVVSPDPPPLANLTTSERRVYDYICRSLREAGVDHVTSGIAIKVICRTYIDWLEALKLCDEEGRYGTARKSGSTYELPHSYTEKQCRASLLKWLPEVCLTVPSLTGVKVKLGDKGQQDDLFADLVNHAQNRPRLSNG